jgi:DNA polymerase III alpha subunit
MAGSVLSEDAQAMVDAALQRPHPLHANNLKVPVKYAETTLGDFHEQYPQLRCIFEDRATPEDVQTLLKNTTAWPTKEELKAKVKTGEMTYSGNSLNYALLLQRKGVTVIKFLEAFEQERQETRRKILGVDTIIIQALEDAIKKGRGESLAVVLDSGEAGRWARVNDDHLSLNYTKSDKLLTFLMKTMNRALKNIKSKEPPVSLADFRLMTTTSNSAERLWNEGLLGALLRSQQQFCTSGDDKYIFVVGANFQSGTVVGIQ